MRWSMAQRCLLSTVFGLFLVVFGVPEAPAFQGEASLAQEIHIHEDFSASTSEAFGYCHPGVDCSVSVALLLQQNMGYEPRYLKTVMQDGATQPPESRPNNDPPPPRKRV